MKIDTCFARQPIFDAAERVAAYEVLYRSAGSKRATFSDPVAATRAVLAGAFADIDEIDRLDGLMGYVNMPRELLGVETVRPYSPLRLGLEVLEGETPDREMLSSLAELRGAGYRIAIDDFTLGDGREILLAHADVVKVDVLAHDADQLLEVADRLRPTGITLLAEKVETRDAMLVCRSLGFELFQGFFFAQPELMSGTFADRNRALVAQLAGLHAAGDDEAALVGVLVAHPALSDAVLGAINSPAIGLIERITSVPAAVAALGARRVFELATAVLLAMSREVSPELANLALTRARLCSSMASTLGHARPVEYFTVGTLSVLDALSDLPMDAVLAEVPLAPDIAEALSQRSGEKGVALSAALAYERARWDEVTSCGYDVQRMAGAYLDAIDWSGRMMVLTGALT